MTTIDDIEFVRMWTKEEQIKDVNNIKDTLRKIKTKTRDNGTKKEN